MFTKSTRDEIVAIAKKYEFEPAAILAIAEVESAGVPFWKVDGRMLPPIRFEGHYFYRLLKGAQRDQAVRRGLAHKSAGVVKNPTSWGGRYDKLAVLKKIDEDAALMSHSWGLGQVMGANWHDLGLSSVQELVQMATSGIAGQVELMIRFIDVNKLRGHVQNRRWAKFASRYNGPAYKKNKYDKKMAAAYKRYKRWENGADVEPESNLRDIQSDLKLLGLYNAMPDGFYGTETAKAIRAFQKSKGLVIDGIVGPITQEALTQAVDEITTRKQTKNGLVGVGVLGAIFGLYQVFYDQLHELAAWIGSLFQ